MIDYDQALSLLERAVAEKGENYIYPAEERKYLLGTPKPMCTYRLSDGSPSCIIGHVAHYLNVLDIAAQHEGASSLEVFEATGIEMTHEAQDLFSYAQYYQDNNMTWGYSIDKAKRRVKRLDDTIA